MVLMISSSIKKIISNEFLLVVIGKSGNKKYVGRERKNSFKKLCAISEFIIIIIFIDIYKAKIRINVTLFKALLMY